MSSCLIKVSRFMHYDSDIAGCPYHFNLNVKEPTKFCIFIKHVHLEFPIDTVISNTGYLMFSHFDITQHGIVEVIESGLKGVVFPVIHKDTETSVVVYNQMNFGVGDQFCIRYFTDKLVEIMPTRMILTIELKK